MVVFDIGIEKSTLINMSVVVVMNGAVDIGVVVHMFHDINFATLRPTNGANILPEHPECRPKALSSRCLQTTFYLSILKRKFIFRN